MRFILNSALLILMVGLTSCEEKDLKGAYEVVTLNGKDITGKGVTINITDEDGYRIGGKNGCNTYGASVEHDGSNNIKIGMAMATKMYCKETAQIEQEFMDNLQQVSSYDLTKGNLILMNANGDELMVAERKKEE